MEMEEFFGEGGMLAEQLPGFKSRPGQLELAKAVASAIDSKRHLIAEAPTGCHVAGQGILLYSGYVKPVERIEVGDCLVGPDGLPRNVLSLARGRQATVEIRPVKGNSWRVNMDHIISLIRTDTGQVVDTSVRDWMKWSKAQKHLYKLFRSPAIFKSHESKLPLDPYFVGVLLGDGSHTTEQVAIHKSDLELHELAKQQAELFGLRTRVADDGSSIFISGESRAVHRTQVCQWRARVRT